MEKKALFSAKESIALLESSPYAFPTGCGMKRLLLGMVVILFASALGAQNWDINVLHKVNGWDNKFVRNYNKVICLFVIIIK